MSDLVTPDVRARLLRYDGAGNLFFLLDERPRTSGDYSELARELCDRDGIYGGADGLLVLLESRVPDAVARMVIINADGSIPEMCGNGARCVFRHLLDEGGDRTAIDTDAGTVTGEVLSREDPWLIRIDLGVPDFTPEAIGLLPFDAHTPVEEEALEETLEIGASRLTFTGVSLGNPHAVIFLHDVSTVDVSTIGPLVEKHRRFANGTNVHFAQVTEDDIVHVRHWERGVGETQACGTGAVAVAAAAIKIGRLESPVALIVPGGELGVEWDGGRALLTGPVVVRGPLA